MSPIRYRPRKADVAWVVALGMLLSQAWRAYNGGQADTVIVGAAVTIIGIPFVRRLDDKCDHDRTHDSAP